MTTKRVGLSLVDQEGSVFPVGHNLVTIGRARDNTLRVDALGVSRYHAVVQPYGDDCVVIDLGSTNGTTLDGQRLQPYQPHWLHPGGVLTLAGQASFTISEGGAERPLSGQKTAVYPQ